MKAPNMDSITKSLEKSMQNFSLSDRRRRVGDRFGRSSTTTEESSNEHVPPISDRTLELNSHISLPCHWEQCLDLKVTKKDSSSSFFFLNAFQVKLITTETSNSCRFRTLDCIKCIFLSTLGARTLFYLMLFLFPSDAFIVSKIV